MIEEEPIINGISYRLDDDNLTAKVIKNPCKRYVGHIEIPDTIKVSEVSYRVTTIGMSAFEECVALTSIVLPNSITSIKKRAFYSCQKLTSITIPDSVTSIGMYAFQNCYSLQEVTIPDSVMSIGERAFDYCKLKQNPIQEIKIDELTYRLLMHNHLAMVVCYDGDSETIDIPSEITYEGVAYRIISIDSVAFSHCESLKEINIPNSITSIGYRAFYRCESLENIIIPDHMTDIEYEAFSGCRLLKAITIPVSVTKLEYDAFKGCNSLSTITFQGTTAQWKNIKSLSFLGLVGVPTTVVHCTDGDVEI